MADVAKPLTINPNMKEFEEALNASQRREVDGLDKQRVKFTFPTALVTQPIIYNLGREFNVITNIRRADVREEMGWLSWN